MLMNLSHKAKSRAVVYCPGLLVCQELCVAPLLRRNGRDAETARGRGSLSHA